MRLGAPLAAGPLAAAASAAAVELAGLAGACSVAAAAGALRLSRLGAGWLAPPSGSGRSGGGWRVEKSTTTRARFWIFPGLLVKAWQKARTVSSHVRLLRFLFAVAA